MNKSFLAINWTTLICLAFVSSWNSSCLDADLVELDGFSVSTDLLSVSGGGEDQESTANYGGPLAGLSSRTLTVGSDFADASAQVAGGQVSFGASGTDFMGQVSYELDIPLSILALGNGMYVEVDSLTADYDIGVWVASLDGNSDPLYAFAGLTLSAPGIYSAEFSSFFDAAPGTPADFSAIRSMGFDIGSLSTSSSNISFGSFGLTTVPEPGSGVVLLLCGLGLVATRRRRKQQSE